MYIMNQTGTGIFNSDSFDLFVITDKPDAKIIGAVKERDESPRILGRYASMPEARDVLANLYEALRYGSDSFNMPLSETVAPEARIHDKRTARKGKS